jgi:hypothetical protein
MNRRLTVVLLVLLVLVAAMSLRNATVGAHPNAGPVVMANGAGPAPPIPWKNAAAPAPWNK